MLITQVLKYYKPSLKKLKKELRLWIQFYFQVILQFLKTLRNLHFLILLIITAVIMLRILIQIPNTRRKAGNGFKYYTYKVCGVGSFNNVYDLVFSIEHSKALKKIESGKLAAILQLTLEVSPTIW